jgi:hypothetical protein
MARDFVCCFDMSPRVIFKVCSKNVLSKYRECSKRVKSVLIYLTSRSWRECAALYDNIFPASVRNKAEKYLRLSREGETKRP